jgi:hypothetical protein
MLNKTSTKIPGRHLETSTTDCCPQFNPSEWDEMLFEMDHKPFIKVASHSLLHVPLDIGSVMKRAQEGIVAAHAETDEFVALSYEASPWHADHYIAVSRPVPGFENVQLSGTFLSRVFEGAYRDAGRWYNSIYNYTMVRGIKPSRIYFYYTTCPSCAKAYGKNYVVGLAQISGMHPLPLL